MIKMLRIDDRLLHGQVAFIWSKHLNIQGIVVANDKLPGDAIQTMAIKMASPENIKLLIKSVDDAARMLNDPRGAAMRILVVVKEPKDAARLMRGMTDPKAIELVNIGNSGRIDRGDKQMLTQEVYVNKEDVDSLHEILNYNLPFEIQMVPTNNKVGVKDVLSRFTFKEGL